MSQVVRDRLTLMAVFFVLLVTKVPTLNSYYVNQEWAFAAATDYYLGRNPQGLELYWSTQANPLGYSLVSAGLLSVTGWPTEPWSMRIPSLLGTVLLFWSGYLLARRHEAASPWCFPIWCLVLLVNPFIYCYACSCTADMLPTGLVVFSLSLAFTSSRIWQLFVAATLLGLATTIKYNALLLWPGLMFAAWNTLSITRYRLVIASVIALVPVLIFAIDVFLVHEAYGYWITPSRYQRMLDTARYRAAWPIIFTMYWTYLLILLGGLAIWPVCSAYARLQSRQFVIVMLACSLLSVSMSVAISGFNLGEMDAGGFDQILPKWLILGIRFVALGLVFVTLYELMISAVRQQNRLAIFVAICALGYLAVASASRPAQRYLLLIYPICCWWAIEQGWAGSFHRLRMIVLSCTLLAMTLASTLGTLYLIRQGETADQCARWIAANLDVKEVYPDEWVLGSHAGQYFPPQPPEPTHAKYRVQLQPTGGDVVHQQPMILFDRVIRTYYVVKLDKSQKK